MENLKVKFLRSSPSKTSLNLSHRKDESSFKSPSSVSSEEVEDLNRSIEIEKQKHFEPLETDFNALSQYEEELNSENFPSSVALKTSTLQ